MSTYSDIAGGDPGHPQVSDCILQSEAEFYSSIRAKCVANGRNFLAALEEDGIEYLEVRLMDINPFSPVGIDEQAIQLLDTLLLYCLLEPSPNHDSVLCEQVNTNLHHVVTHGRNNPELQDGSRALSLTEWGTELLARMQPVAQLLGDAHQQTIAAQLAKINEPDLTPSAIILRELKENNQSWLAFGTALMQQHATTFDEVLSAQEVARQNTMVQQSLAQQLSHDGKPGESFNDYLKHIHQEYVALLNG